MHVAPAEQHIVIVEDDTAVLNSLEFMFTAAGYRVSAFERSDAAAALPGLESADCFVVDFALPDQDGLTLLAQLRARGVKAPAILIASTPSRQCRERARDAGVPLVEKPLDSESLGAWVRTLTGRPTKGSHVSESKP